MRTSPKDIFVTAGFGIALAIIAVIAALYYVDFTAMTEFDLMVERSNNIIVGQEELLTAVNDVEIGELTFILTGDEKLLEPYRDALRRIDQNLADMKGLTRDRQVQVGMARLESLIRAKTAEVAETIRVRKTAGFLVAYRREFSEGHEATQAEIRKQLAETRDLVRRLLLRRKALEQANTVKTMQVFIAGTTLSLLLLIAIFFHFKRDLAERSRAERLLRLSECRFRALYQDNPTMIETVDAELITLSANATCRAELGYAEGELEGRSALELFHPDDRAAVAQELRRCLQNPHQVYRWEFRKVRKDGSTLWVEETAQAVYDLHSRLNVLVVCQDVTERKKANDEREQTLLQLQAVLESINEGVVITDLRGNVVTMNREALALNDFDNLDQARGAVSEYREKLELLNLEGRPVPKEEWPLPRVLRGERLIDYEVQIRRKDTGKMWVGSINGTLVHDKAGDPILAVLTERDVTRRKRTEEELTIAKAQLQMITDVMPVGVVRCSRDHRFLWVNTEYAKWLGRLPEEIAGHGLEEIIGAKGYGELKPYIERVLAGEKVDFEGNLEYKGLGDRWISAKYIPTFDEKELADGWVAVVSDITMRKQMENELAQAKEHLEQRVAQRTMELSTALNKLQVESRQRLQAVEELQDKERMLIHQSRLAAMGEMIGNIAHQWRQPLNMLGLLVQDLSMTYRKGPFSREYLEESVKRALETINHMSKTIDDFMYFFRPRTARENFKVLMVIEKTIHLLEGSLKMQGISTEVIAASDPVVNGYANEFSQVFLNLIANARDAFASHQVKEPRVTIAIGTEDGKCIVTVSDNAGGIPEEIMGKIFDPYFTTKGPDKGTGVGLYMSKMIIEKNMGGRLSVRNVEDGAEFKIEI